LNPLLVRLLALLAILWGGLALVYWIFQLPAVRAALALLTGGILLGAFGWYCMERWALHVGRAEPGRLRKPTVVCAAAWVLCLGTALTVAFTRRDESASQAGQPERPRSKLFPDGPRRFLSELEEFDVVPGKWPFRKGDTGDGHHIIVGGVKSPHGLGMHPPWAPKFASVKYRLGLEAELFKATVAIDDSTNWCWSPATFTVRGDGTELWRSQWIPRDKERRQECRVVIKGVNVLELRVHVENGSDGVHAVWFEPRIFQTADAPDEPAKEALSK
jgi:hypothetical protein